MAKAKKKPVKKAAKKAVKKAPARAPKKAAKKAAKKSVKKAVKKVVKKAARKAAPRPAKKAVRKAAKKAAPRRSAPSGKRFLVIYHAPLEAMEQMAGATAEQQAAGMQSWMDWAGGVGERLVDLGAPLMNGQKVTPGGDRAPSSRDVTGYSVVLADNLEHALRLLQSNPHLSGWHPEATVEVHESVLMPDM